MRYLQVGEVWQDKEVRRGGRVVEITGFEYEADSDIIKSVLVVSNRGARSVLPIARLMARFRFYGYRRDEVIVLTAEIPQ